jgi:hypothetical protein
MGHDGRCWKIRVNSGGDPDLLLAGGEASAGEDQQK